MYCGLSVLGLHLQWFTYSQTSSCRDKVRLNHDEKDPKQVSESQDSKFLPCRWLSYQNSDWPNPYFVPFLTTPQSSLFLKLGDKEEFGDTSPWSRPAESQVPLSRDVRIIKIKLVWSTSPWQSIPLCRAGEEAEECLNEAQPRMHCAGCRL